MLNIYKSQPKKGKRVLMLDKMGIITAFRQVEHSLLGDLYRHKSKKETCGLQSGPKKHAYRMMHLDLSIRDQWVAWDLTGNYQTYFNLQELRKLGKISEEKFSCISLKFLKPQKISSPTSVLQEKLNNLFLPNIHFNPTIPNQLSNISNPISHRQSNHTNSLGCSAHYPNILNPGPNHNPFFS